MSRRNFECEMKRAVASGVGDPQTDPNAMLGGFRSSTTIDELDGSITDAGDLYHFTDAGLLPTSTDYTGSWIIFFGEDAFVAATDEVNFAVEVIGFDTVTGEFTLDGPLPIVSVVGRVYRLYTPNSVFDAWDALTSVSREPRYRLMFIHALGNGTTNGPYNVWITDHQPGPLILEIACSTMAELDAAAIEIPGIANERVEPDIETTAGAMVGTGDEGGPQTWRRSPANQAELMTPRRGDTTALPGLTHRALWMRLRFRDNATIPRPQTCVWQVHAEGTASEPERGASFMVIVDIDGPDLEIVMGPDRKNRRLGGSRVRVIVRDSVTGLPVPNYTPAITLDTAEGTLHPQNQEETSDDGVVTQRVYTSSILDGDVGKDIDFSLEVF